MASRDIRRKFGQNYLSDPAIIFEMSRAISPLDGDNFFEIGPGMGALTNVLNLPGINVKAIDVDNKNIEYLKKQYLAPAKFDFIHGDVLSASLDFLEKDRYRIVGNLPYNISTQIILMFSNWSHLVGDLHFLVQKEVAEKIAGKIASKNWTPPRRTPCLRTKNQARALVRARTPGFGRRSRRPCRVREPSIRRTPRCLF